MTASVYTPSASRNPPHLPATPRPRSFIASQVIDERQRHGALATRAVLDYLDFLPTLLPRGTRAAPVRAGATMHALAGAIVRAVRAGWGRHEGGAVELADALRRAGHLLLVRTPSPQIAGMAMAELARICPLIEEIRRGRYRIHAGRASDLPDSILGSLLKTRPGDAFGPADCEKNADLQAGIDASADPADQSSQSAATVGNRERARGDLQEGPSRSSSGDQLGLALVYPGAVACSSSAPAVQAGARPRRSPARAPAEREGSPVWTRIAWVQAVPLRPHLQRVALFALARFGEGRAGSLAEVAAWIAAEDPHAGSRLRAATRRALASLRDRGLVIERDGSWHLPEFVPHPALELFDLDESPSAQAPSPAMAAHLERQGIDPAGLTHEEAIAVQRRLHGRRVVGLPSAWSVARVVRAQQAAGREVRLAQLGRRTKAEVQQDLAEAMAMRWRREQTEREFARGWT